MSFRDGTLLSDSANKSNLFIDVFANNFILPDVDTPPLWDLISWNILIKHKTVKSIINGFDVNKSPEPDQIPAIVLNKCSLILSKLFHLIVSNSQYPKSWRTTMSIQFQRSLKLSLNSFNIYFI